VPDVPPALEEIIIKVLSKEPSARYRTADQLGRVLQKFGAAHEEGEEPVAPSLNPSIASRLPTVANPSVGRTPPPTPVVSNATPPPVLNIEPDLNNTDIDWASVGLGLLALIAVGGLIPFWIMVYFAYNRP
jgi:serine/threonine-protein kinase